MQAPEDADNSASDRAQRELVLWFVNLAREYFIKYPGKLPRFLDGSAEEKAEITMDILDAARDVGNPRERQANHEAISWGSRGPSPGRASNPSRSASSISPRRPETSPGGRRHVSGGEFFRRTCPVRA